MKKTCLLLMALIVGILLAPTAASADYVPPICEIGTPITLHVDGEYVPCDVDPIARNGRTLMPMRAAGEALGAYVEWNGNTECITVLKGGNEIRFFLGQNVYNVNGVLRTTDVAPIVIQNRTMLPLRVFAEALGTHVDWDQQLLDVSISTGGSKVPLPTPAISTANDVYQYVRKYYTPGDVGPDVLGSWVRYGSECGVPTETYEFFYNTKSGIQNIELVAQYRDYYSFPTIKVYKSTTSYVNGEYWRENYQNILYLKDAAHNYMGHSDTAFRMINGELTTVGTIWYDMETDAYDSYTPIGPYNHERF